MHKFSVLKLLPSFKGAARHFKPAAGKSSPPHEGAAHEYCAVEKSLDGQEEKSPSPALTAFYEKHERFKRGRGG